MKHRIAVPLGMVSAFAFLSCQVSGAETSFESFTLRETRGSSCEVMPVGAAGWSAAREGETQKAGTKGRTGARSSFVAAFDEQNRFRLLPGTEVIIRTSTRDPKFSRVVSLNLERGGVDVDLKAFPKGYQLKVQTPTAVCGAVGTAFSVRSDRRESNRIECREGKVFARSAEDGSFSVSSLAAGQTLDAELAPGKENSHSRLRTEGGDLAVALGSGEARVTLREGSVVQLAQQRADSTSQVAMKIERGRVDNSAAGRYVVENGVVKNVSGDERLSSLVDDYVGLARSEGATRSELEVARARGAPAAELARARSRLDAAAAAASAKRAELFTREEIRRPVREGLEMDRVRPTTIPR